jgi:hypothetical protein
MNRLTRALCAFAALLLLAPAPAAAAQDTDALFSAALSALRTPKAEALATGALTLRLGETAYVPTVAPEITPFDQLPADLPPVSGTFDTSDPAVVAVDASGLMTAVAEGSATVTHRAPQGDTAFAVAVSATAMPERIKALVYVAKREYLSVHRARLPKYNQYAKWYYGKKKEVGWCSVFTIWCANASGTDPVQEETLSAVPEGGVALFREGQVGNQYDGFFKLNRFTGVPKPGYLVIYGDLANGYRTTHIGIVVDAVDAGGGLYRVTTVEGNMSNTVKSYTYLYDSAKANHTVGVEKGKKLQRNMAEVPKAEQTDPLTQYTLHTDHWCVFGFGATWQ